MSDALRERKPPDTPYASPPASAVTAEAAYAARHFGIEAHLLILDSCDEAAFAEHARIVAKRVSTVPMRSCQHRVRGGRA
ncbi:DUF6271 family protein [Streptomyces sp. NPDC059909]|uniref:DUF6271 family protein n=1 Tax=Streptomyces sp. NPDC059909 TaxID=3346998 RepID=UPI00365E5960